MVSFSSVAQCPLHCLSRKVLIITLVKHAETIYGNKSFNLVVCWYTTQCKQIEYFIFNYFEVNRSERCFCHGSVPVFLILEYFLFSSLTQLGVCSCLYLASDSRNFSWITPFCYCTGGWSLFYVPLKWQLTANVPILW